MSTNPLILDDDTLTRLVIKAYLDPELNVCLRHFLECENGSEEELREYFADLNEELEYEDNE